jgi:hypothetical protein
MRQAASKAGRTSRLIVQMNRVVVAAGDGESLDVTAADAEFQLELAADIEVVAPH